MTEQEKVEFLSEKIKELNRITSEIEAVFPEKSFKLDGILVGNIVEVLTAQAYGITLYRQSEKTHDGEVDGKKVEITGKIDRVDKAVLSNDQYVRIIDYKSSYKDIDMNQVVSGLQIQLIAYIDAICEQTEYKPSGMLYMGLIDNVVKKINDQKD